MKSNFEFVGSSIIKNQVLVEIKKNYKNMIYSAFIRTAKKSIVKIENFENTWLSYFTQYLFFLVEFSLFSILMRNKAN